jgi:hypothetical protein
MMRTQSIPASDPTVDGLAQPQIHEELDAAESSTDSQMRSDQHQRDKVWREYHPLLTGE